MKIESFLASEESLDSFIRDFEAGTWPKTQWTHGAHLAVGAVYILAYPPKDAEDRMRRGIRFYNESVGGQNTPTSGYHETLTIFWLAIVRRYLNGGHGDPRIDQVRNLVNEYRFQTALHRDYYDFDVVQSQEARATWIPPTTKSLD